MLFNRRHLRKTLERLKTEHPEHLEKIQSVETSKPLMSMLHEKVKELPGATEPRDTGRPILDWLWNHREEILKFILSIVMMFVSGS